jgi:Ubiquitin carboxyl-terminal hydrolase
MLPFTTLYVSPDSFTKSRTNGASHVMPNGTSLSPEGKKVNGKSESGKAESASDGSSYAGLLAEPKEFWSPDILSYDLSAVIVHKGEINSGHYVNYAREGGDWFLFDDSKVVRVDEGEVLKAEAYLLIYVVRDVTPWLETPESS